MVAHFPHLRATSSVACRPTAAPAALDSGSRAIQSFAPGPLPAASVPGAGRL